ncbi:MAG: hypothetical protein DGJ47_000583, partial [Rickettsiaceae bacterium]
RVSIPATYRSGLSKEEIGGIVVYPSFKNNCIEVCSMSRLSKLNELISHLDPYSSERDAFETVILGESIHLQFDNEGRVSLPSHLMESVAITTQACIVGKGAVFEIWNPDNFAKHLDKAKEIAQNNRAILKNIHFSENGDKT